MWWQGFGKGKAGRLEYSAGVAWGGGRASLGG